VKGHHNLLAPWLTERTSMKEESES
jgi:hypothetical protein